MIVAHLRGGPADGTQKALSVSAASLSIPVGPGGDWASVEEPMTLERAYYLRRDNGLRPASFSARWRNSPEHHQIYDWDELPPARLWSTRYTFPEGVVATVEDQASLLRFVGESLMDTAMNAAEDFGLEAAVEDMVWRMERSMSSDDYSLSMRVVAQ